MIHLSAGIRMLAETKKMIANRSRQRDKDAAQAAEFLLNKKPAVRQPPSICNTSRARFARWTTDDFHRKP